MPSKTAALLLLLLLCAACGGGGGSPSTPSSPSPTIPVASACTAVGQAASASTISIVNGVECSSANSPVVLLNVKDERGQQAGSCTGTVIAPRAILTAAHGFPAAAASVKVFLGTGPELIATSFAGFPGDRDGDGATRDVGVVLMGEDIGRMAAASLTLRGASTLKTEDCRMQIFGLSIIQLSIGARGATPESHSSIDDRQSVNLQSAICNLQ